MIVDQAEFAGALLNPGISAPNGLVDPNGRPAGKRFDVYRNNVMFSLINAMQIAFPVIHKLLGDSLFKAISATYVRTYPPKSPILMFYGEDFPTFLSEVQQSQNLPYLGDVARLELARRHSYHAAAISATYVRTYPPKSPILMFYGEDFPAFLTGNRQTQHLPYLGDIARLELARRHSYHAADIPAITPERLADLSPEDLLDIRLTLSPMMQIVTSYYPILSIWRMHMIQAHLGIDMHGETIMVSRPALDVEMHKLDAPTYGFLTQLKNKSLGDAYDAAIKIDKGFDLSQAIGLLLGQNIITKIIS